MHREPCAERVSPEPRGPTGRRTSTSDMRTTGGTAARGIPPLVDAILEMLGETLHLAVVSRNWKFYCSLCADLAAFSY